MTNIQFLKKHFPGLTFKVINGCMYFSRDGGKSYLHINGAMISKLSINGFRGIK